MHEACRLVVILTLVLMMKHLADWHQRASLPLRRYYIGRQITSRRPKAAQIQLSFNQIAGANRHPACAASRSPSSGRSPWPVAHTASILRLCSPVATLQVPPLSEADVLTVHVCRSWVPGDFRSGPGAMAALRRRYPGLGKRFGATLADTESRRFIQGYVLSTFLHQDPRYFPSSKKRLIARAWYPSYESCCG